MIYELLKQKSLGSHCYSTLPVYSWHIFQWPSRDYCRASGHLRRSNGWEIHPNRAVLNHPHNVTIWTWRITSSKIAPESLKSIDVAVFRITVAYSFIMKITIGNNSFTIDMISCHVSPFCGVAHLAFVMFREDIAGNGHVSPSCEMKMVNDATTSHLCVLWNFHSQKNKQFEDLGAKLFAIGLRLCFGPYITLSFQPFPLGCSFTQNTSVT